MKKTLPYLLIIVLLYGCGSKSNEPEPASPPEKALLALPAQNEVCAPGTVISASQSTVNFKWNASANADSYEVSVKNLETGAVLLQSTPNTQTDITLSRNTPYSWFVTSKSSKIATTVQSDTWKFFNAGTGIINYAPFPADITYPLDGQTINVLNGKVTLTWAGSDVDNDIKDYTIYLGTSVNPSVYKEGVTATTITDVPVTNGTYYWKIVTIDSKGNKSDSGISTFKVAQ